MKRLRPFAAALLVITLLLCQIITAWSISGTSAALLNDYTGSFLCKLSGNCIKTFDIKNSKTYSYTFNSDVMAYCVSGGKLYATLNTDQPGIISVACAKNGKMLGETTVFDKNISKSTDISVDSAGRIYLLNKKNNVDIFDSNGRFIRTTDRSFFSVIQCGGKAYAIGSKGIYLLRAESDKKLNDLSSGNNIYAVSDNYIADNAGNVFSAKSGKRVLSLALNKKYSIGESSNYILALNGKTVRAYNKTDGAFVNSVELGFSPIGLCADGKNIYVLRKNGDSVKKINESAFKIETIQESSQNKQQKILTSSSTKSDSAPPVILKGLNFGKYKVSGKYICVEPQTLRSEFKSNITYEGYDLKFSKQSGLGTGTKAKFTRNGKTYTYTFIVMGDINGTGTVNSRDVKIMFNCLFGINTVGGVYKTAADMNGDEKLSNADLVMLDKIIN